MEDKNVLVQSPMFSSPVSFVKLFDDAKRKKIIAVLDEVKQNMTEVTA